MIEPYKKGKDISIMIWAAIWGTERSELIIMSRDSQSKKKGYSANSYIKVLKKSNPNLLKTWFYFYARQCTYS
jgi:hypothetical protein